MNIAEMDRERVGSRSSVGRGKEGPNRLVAIMGAPRTVQPPSTGVIILIQYWKVYILVYFNGCIC